MVAVRGILAGEQVYISYTELLAPTLARQHALLTNKLFLCQVSCHASRVTLTRPLQCERCVDPTELASHAGSLKCPACVRRGGSGSLAPASAHGDSWGCGECGHSAPAAAVTRLVLGLQQEVDSLVESSEAGPRQLEAGLAKLGRVLGPRHASLARIRYSLCGLYGRAPGHQLAELSLEQLQR